MAIFCPRCGRENQKKTIYCRDCGEKLPELKQKVVKADFLNKIKIFSTVNFGVSAAASLLCSFFAIYLMINFKELFENYRFIPITFLILAIIFLANSMLSIYTKFYLKKTNFEFENDTKQKSVKSKTREFLKEADFSDNVPPSVIENTTRKLKEKVVNERKTD